LAGIGIDRDELYGGFEFGGCGQLASATPAGAAFRHLPQTPRVGVLDNIRKS